MGRRSKHKQADPAAFVEKTKPASNSKPSSSSSKPKRKAEDQESSKPNSKSSTVTKQVVKKQKIAPVSEESSSSKSKVQKKKQQLPEKKEKKVVKSKVVQTPIEEDDDDDDSEGEGFSGIEDIPSSDEEDDDEEEEEVPKQNGKGKGKAGPPPTIQEDEIQNMLDSLPPPGTKLSKRDQKKALAEAERLELLLKSQGYSLESDEEEGAEGEYDEDDEDVEGDENEGLLEQDQFDSEAEDDGEDSLTSEQLAFLDGQDEDEDDEMKDLDSNSESDDEDDEEGEMEEDDLQFHLPTVQELEEEKAGTLDLRSLQIRIQELVTVLSDFGKLGQKGKSRNDYFQLLKQDVCNYYGYNEWLAEKILDMFSVGEAVEFFEANETPRPVTIRANTLRTRRRDLAQALINRGVSLEPVGNWTKVGLQVFESSVPLGATPEYLAGHYMLQAASSLLPCIALAPKPNEKVLDMASAPGGKSAYLSAIMQNTGTVWANDSNRSRIKSLNSNLHRLGCKNVIVTNYDGRQFPKVMGGFDRVLLDSPCSGTGVISKDQSVKTNKSQRDLQLLTHLQKQLLLCAIDSINTKSAQGGYVVYSTCSVLVDEDEAVVQYALNKRENVSLVPTGIEFGRDGFKKHRGKNFDDKMNWCRRVYPHAHNLDGFFVAKLKVSPRTKHQKAKNASKSKKVDDEDEEEAAVTGIEDDEVSEEEDEEAGEKTKGPFDDEEDEEIMKRSREKLERKRKRNVKGKGKAEKEPVEK